MASPSAQCWELPVERKRADHSGQQDSWSRESCNHDEHLRSRTEGRLRAGTSGYGEVRVGTVRLGARVAEC